MYGTLIEHFKKHIPPLRLMLKRQKNCFAQSTFFFSFLLNLVFEYLNSWFMSELNQIKNGHQKFRIKIKPVTWKYS